MNSQSPRSVFHLMTFCAVLGMSLWAAPARGQVVTVSQEFVVREEYAFELLGWMGDRLLLFKDEGHRRMVQAFDEEMRIRWEREVFLGDRRADILRTIGDGDRFHVIYGMRDRGDYFLYHHVYDPEINLIDSSIIEVVQNVFLTPRVFLRVSEDKSKVLLFHEDQEYIKCWSYDLGTKQGLWSGAIRMQGSNLYRDFSHMRINNSGDLFVLLRPGGFLERAQSLELFYSDHQSAPGEILRQTISLDGAQVYDFRTRYDEVNRYLVLTGMYSERNISRAQGFFYGRIRPGREIRMHLLPFDQELLQEVHGREVASSKGLTDFVIQDVALRQDGGAVIIAELNKEYTRRTSIPLRRESSGFATGGWVDYYYEDIILLAIHPDGSEHWRQVLRKRQYSQDDNAKFSSFFLFRTPDRLRFLFNDEIKQENTIGGYEVTGLGRLTRKTVFNTDYHRLKMRFRHGEQVAYNECIIPSERSNRMNLVRIQFEE